MERKSNDSCSSFMLLEWRYVLINFLTLKFTGSSIFKNPALFGVKMADCGFAARLSDHSEEVRPAFNS